MPVPFAIGAVIASAVGAVVSYVFRYMLVVALVYALYRFLLTFGGTFLDWLLSKVGGLDLSQATIEFVGLGAWLAERLHLAECASLAISFAVTAFALSAVKSSIK